MTITPGVRSQLFDVGRNSVIQVPYRAPQGAAAPPPPPPPVSYHHSTHPHSAYYGDVPVPVPVPVTVAAAPVRPTPATTHGLPWTEEEHARFILGLEQFPEGPWRRIAEVVGSRNARQTMSHAQKYRMKIQRRERKKQKQKKTSEEKRPAAPATAQTVAGAAELGRLFEPRSTTAPISYRLYKQHSLELDVSIATSLPMQASGSHWVLHTIEERKSELASFGSTLPSPLAFDQTPIPELAPDLRDFLCSAEISESAGAPAGLRSHSTPAVSGPGY